MEIHQIRYFLALSKSLNFTRAAEECHVSQPALTRAVQALEAELGGPLILRERRTSHLTDLGKRMLPLLQRCYDSAMSAKELARAAANPDAAPLRLALSDTINLECVMGAVAAMFETFPNTHLTLVRGGAADLLEVLKAGDADIAIACAFEHEWDRLDDWTLWEEGFRAVIAVTDPLSKESSLKPEQLAQRALIAQVKCESRGDMEAWLSAMGVRATLHEVASQSDVGACVEAGLGIGLQPESGAGTAGTRLMSVEGMTVRRSVNAYAVAGRARTPPANALLALLRTGAARARVAA